MGYLHIQGWRKILKTEKAGSLNKLLSNDVTKEGCRDICNAVQATQKIGPNAQAFSRSGVVALFGLQEFSVGLAKLVDWNRDYRTIRLFQNHFGGILIYQGCFNFEFARFVPPFPQR